MMGQSALTTAAWIAHDVGLAAGFGGTLFGKLALNPALKLISSKPERGQVMNKAWTGFNIVNAISLGTAATTWIVGRSLLSGKEIDKKSRALVLAKDVLLSTTVATGLFDFIGGIVLARQATSKTGGAIPVESGGQSSDMPQKMQTLQKVVGVVGTVNLLASAGVIGLTAVLGTKAGKSGTWKFLSRFLP